MKGSLLRESAIAFLIKILGSGLTFFLGILIARMVGAEGAGVYFLALAVMTVVSIIARIGLDNTLLKYIATRASHADWAGVRGVFNLGMRIGGLSVFLASLCFFSLSSWLAVNVFSKPELVDPLRWMSLAIFGFSMLNLQAECLKGLHRIRDAMLLQGVAMPLLVLLLVVPAAEMAGVTGVSVAYLFGSLSAVLLGFWLWRRAIGSGAEPSIAVALSDIWPTCRSLWGVAILNGAILPWMPLFLIGVWVSSEEVGVFGASLRVAMLVSLLLGVMNNLVASKFAALYAKGDIDELGKVARHAVMLLAVIGTPILLVMVFANEWIMSLYGPEFIVGGSVLVILAVGELINISCGPVGLLLAMTGHEKRLRNATLFAFAVQLSLCLALIPTFGMYGAAIAVTSGVVVNNFFAIYYVRKFVGIAYPIKLGGQSV